jgi:prephenate dehydratase
VATRIAYLGPAGTFTEEAALLHNPGATLEPFPSIQRVALAAASGIAQEGVVPIENSLEGSVNDTLDILVRQDGLSIRRELVLPIEHCLLMMPGSNSADIQVIYSHPQALGQCRGFLEERYPKAQLIASLSTAAAVGDVKKSKLPAAAIASYRSAQHHGVEVITRGIQDNSSNVTRFVVLAPTDHPPTGADKTSLCFAFAEDKPGLLHTILGELVKQRLNLVKVESRPSRQSLGDYIFLIDINGHREDPPVKEAIQALRQQTAMLKIFGSYPLWTPNANP